MGASSFVAADAVADCMSGCNDMLSACSGGCSEEATTDNAYVAVCETECTRNHFYCKNKCDDLAGTSNAQ
ncbi:hypothetical protein ATCC90586_005515 [Pythium insidiosum]|nr:hypothetical protein ATCC90586_005515 [Pythium insidiosum]